MSNCLVKKLSANVSNPNILLFGQIECVNTYDDKPHKIVVSGNGIVIKTKKVGDYFVVGQASYLNDPTKFKDNYAIEDDSSVNIHFPAGNHAVYIYNKYALKELTVGTSQNHSIFNINQFEGTQNLVVNIDCHQCNTSGDISALKDNTLLETLILAPSWTSEAYSLDCKGDIVSLSKCTNLKSLSTGHTSISGTIEEFVAGQYANNRTAVTESEPINLSYSMTDSLTFGGVHYNYSCCLTYWASNGIALFCGGSTVSECNLVYHKNATAQQISDWETAGKTVREV